MSLVGIFTRKGPSGFGYRSTAEEVTDGLDLRGRNILVTGGNSGLGLETVRVLALRGACVIATGRSEDKVRSACRGMEGEIVPLACELTDPQSVRACADAVIAKRGLLDAIICNAGVIASPKVERVLGYERVFFTNHVGHFILVTNLLGRLAQGARVVMVTSGAHRVTPSAGIELDNLSGSEHYSRWRAYGQSKLANLLFAKELARRLGGHGRTANAVDPGAINTNLARHTSALLRAGMSLASPVLFKNVAQGAATQCYVATNPTLDSVSGEYFRDCNIAPSSPLSQDSELAAQLWAQSERIARSLS
ncbi:MAG TPA: SDR family NAD(P)-dependent oxidoreductase [Polyangiaceae bacterium]|nr:SDR family NAD(P)-dependent oxidoreductase [Polyangiaceae bacterium]